MSDAEKYAKVFRAAADGLAVLELQAWEDHMHTYSKPGETPLGYVRSCMTRRPNDQSAAVWLAYDGVASMFEKIAEAEKEGAE